MSAHAEARARGPPKAAASDIAVARCALAGSRTVAGRHAGCVRLPRLHPRRMSRFTVLSQAATQEDVAEMERRLQSQVTEGKVRNVTGQGAGRLMKEGWVLLDVRPPNEVKKVSVEGAVEVPLFVPDKSLDISSLLKQMSAFGMGGWWLGGTHMIPNEKFMKAVLSKIPKDSKIIVACQKGLRSLAACEQLSRAGYNTLAWINGGFDTAEEGDLPVEDGKDIRYAGIGGVSALLGWTDVQQQNKKENRLQNILKITALIVVLDALVFGYEQVQYMMSQ